MGSGFEFGLRGVDGSFFYKKISGVFRVGGGRVVLRCELVIKLVWLIFGCVFFFGFSVSGFLF